MVKFWLPIAEEYRKLMFDMPQELLTTISLLRDFLRWERLYAVK